MSVDIFCSDPDAYTLISRLYCTLLTSADLGVIKFLLLRKECPVLLVQKVDINVQLQSKVCLQ